MKISRESRRAAAITLSKGKMYEYGIDEEDHIALPSGIDLEMQFPHAIGTLGDFASDVIAEALDLGASNPTALKEVVFSAQVLQAYDESLLSESLSSELLLLSAAGFYLGGVPGSAAVQVAKITEYFDDERLDDFSLAVKLALDRPWRRTDYWFDHKIQNILADLRTHFQHGGSARRLRRAVRELRAWAYDTASPHQLLLADLLGAVAITRLETSAWTLLPRYSDLPVEFWEPYLSRDSAIKEMWPSQRLLGEAGLYAGSSGVVQMPTSAGKSRATELIIRSAFLSCRTRLALVIAPFRALCQEIANDLTVAFSEDGYEVNQPSDAMQFDVASRIFGVSERSSPRVVVLTPEKLLYMLRQDSDLVQDAGLVVYDEGHQFDTDIRGVTYELLLTSVKRFLPRQAQCVLISAVVENADAIAAWLLDDARRVVADKTTQARRLVAFTSRYADQDGQLRFNVTESGEQEFFVPRVIVQQRLQKKRGERVERFFPTTESGSTALYLALRVVGNGGVAIYAGRKASAAKIVRDAVEVVFARGVSFLPPSEVSDPDEIRRFEVLCRENFGSRSYITKAAKLGIFAHHGNTPHGVRLSIEYAMRKRSIKLIVCTSTLAQGVNLPIRYLLVTSSMQGREAIKARDFHNLMGRAGRAGMYGEGTIIFTDSRLYDERGLERKRWEEALDLLNPSGVGPTGSTLLSLLAPLKNANGTHELTAADAVTVAMRLVTDWDGLYADAANLSPTQRYRNFTVDSVRQQLAYKKRIIEAIESFLMTHRYGDSRQIVIATALELAQSTFAYSLATYEQRESLEDVFEAVMLRIEELVPEPEMQNRFGRTLLGIDKSMEIDQWIRTKSWFLIVAEDADAIFDLLWPLLIKLSTEKRLADISPAEAVRNLADGWLAGHTFGHLCTQLEDTGASYPHGAQRRLLDIDRVVGLCEHTFGYEFSLIIAAVKEAFLALNPDGQSEEFAQNFDLLQKRLKYGLPDNECVAYFEAGFSDRVVAQALADSLVGKRIRTSKDVRRLARNSPVEFDSVLQDYPAYFTSVVAGLALS